MSNSMLLSQIILSRIRRRWRQEAQARRRRYFAYFRRRRYETANVMILLLSMYDSRERVPRSIWALPKSVHWWNNIVLATWDDQMWLENFRMTKATFRYLLKELKPHISKKDTNFRKATPPDQRLAITLWRLAANIAYSTLADLFEVGISSVCLITLTVTAAINIVFRKRLTLPTGERLQECIQRFEDKGFPQAVAAIDCCHIPVKTPRKQEYINRKGFSSMILQAVVDSFGQFIDVSVGCPGSMDDAAVFRNSEMSRMLKDDSLFNLPPKVIEATLIPVLVLAGEAYPLMPTLMKPYSVNGTLTAAQKVFNRRLSSCHSTVSRAFEHLKGRWNILHNMQDNQVTKVPSIVLSCCILHNLVESRGEPFLDEWSGQDGFPVPHGLAQDDAGSGANASSIRNALTLHFIDNAPGEK